MTTPEDIQGPEQVRNIMNHSWSDFKAVFEDPFHSMDKRTKRPTAKVRFTVDNVGEQGQTRQYEFEVVGASSDVIDVSELDKRLTKQQVGDETIVRYSFGYGKWTRIE